LAYSPLAQGVLTNKYNRGSIPKNSRAAGESRGGMWDFSFDKIEKADRIARLCEQHSLTPSAVALAWCLRRSEVSSVITFCTNNTQLKENLSASDYSLDASLLGEIEKILGNSPVNQYTNQAII
jgi:aryl-alcohol dehydrogenase-like predicted oxidoreductase